jgi:hypothetical protein
MSVTKVHMLAARDYGLTVQLMALEMLGARVHLVAAGMVTAIATRGAFTAGTFISSGTTAP